jgi:hypothetical protein
MATDHSILVKSSGGNPIPIGVSADPNQPCPTMDNPLICQYPCTMPGHNDTVWMYAYADGRVIYWSVTDGTTWPDAGPNSTPITTPDEADDINYGAVYIHYDPPIDGM